MNPDFQRKGICPRAYRCEQEDRCFSDADCADGEPCVDNLCGADPSENAGSDAGLSTATLDAAIDSDRGLVLLMSESSADSSGCASVGRVSPRTSYLWWVLGFIVFFNRRRSNRRRP